VLTQPKGLNDQGKVNNGREHDVEFFESRVDAAKSFETAE